MSEQEQRSLFLQEMRKTLLRIFVPIAVAGILAVGSFVIAAPFRIKANEQKIDAFENNYVSNTLMVAYMNELRSLTKTLANHESFNKAEFDRINQRIDRLIESIPRSVTRGGPEKDSNKIKGDDTVND